MKSIETLLPLIRDDELGSLVFDWDFWANPPQRLPPGDWSTWLLMGGRGAGKTKAGAEWVRRLASAGVGPIAIVGETMIEALQVMVRGQSGILRVTPPDERPMVRGQMLFWPNGTEGLVLGAADPERFRGPQFAAAWSDELGCAAVDKGANQPNRFPDEKSADDGRPWFSSGAPDPLMQRQFLRAQLAYWADHPMVERISLWTWDARPYPAFPAEQESWADAVNHEAGHWLTGRLGALASDELAAAVAADFGTTVTGVAALPLVHGLAVEALVTARDALGGMLGVTGLSMREGGGGLELVRPSARLAVAVGEVVAGDGALRSRRRGDPSEATRRWRSPMPIASGITSAERQPLRAPTAPWWRASTRGWCWTRWVRGRRPSGCWLRPTVRATRSSWHCRRRWRGSKSAMSSTSPARRTGRSRSPKSGTAWHAA